MRIGILSWESLHSIPVGGVAVHVSELAAGLARDWPFMMTDAHTAAYGHERFREHMVNFIGLYRQIHAGAIDAQWLARLREKNNIFPDLDIRHFA
jgi:1,4-alpha-glucan branching enzyme